MATRNLVDAMILGLDRGIIDLCGGGVGSGGNNWKPRAGQPSNSALSGQAWTTIIQANEAESHWHPDLSIQILSMVGHLAKQSRDGSSEL